MKRRHTVAIAGTLWVTAALVWTTVLTANGPAHELNTDELAAAKADTLHSAPASPPPATDSASVDSAAPTHTIAPENTDSAAAPAPDCINVNTADLEQLQKLPRIGPVLAQRIVAFRQAHGKFTDAASLQKVKGIGAATVTTLKDQACF